MAVILKYIPYLREASRMVHRCLKGAYNSPNSLEMQRIEASPSVLDLCVRFWNLFCVQHIRLKVWRSVSEQGVLACWVAVALTSCHCSGSPASELPLLLRYCFLAFHGSY